jgi:hypothetical protein
MFISICRRDLVAEEAEEEAWGTEEEVDGDEAE